jgi:putative heme transporter
VSGPLRRWGGRVVALVVTGVGLYVVAPGVLTLLDQWPGLRVVRPWWFVLVALLELCSWASLWVLDAIVLPRVRWQTIASSQLAGNAASCVLPGGSATGSVVQASMLVRAGEQTGTVAGALGAVGLLTTGMLLALPLLTIPAVIIHPPPARQLQLGLVVSVIVALVLVGVGLALLRSTRLIGLVGSAAGQVVHLVRRTVPAADIREKVIAQRDAVAAAFEGHWVRALGAAAGNRMFDYAALVASVYAVGGQARPSMVLLAYVLSLALALVPVTPGGLGFVEAGLTSILVLAGVSADAAVLAVLLYRTFQFWLPIPIGALAWAGWHLHDRHTSGSSTGDEPIASP